MFDSLFFLYMHTKKAGRKTQWVASHPGVNLGISDGAEVAQAEIAAV